MRIDSTGGVTVRTGLSAMGQGIETALAQVAAQHPRRAAGRRSPCCPATPRPTRTPATAPAPAAAPRSAAARCCGRAPGCGRRCCAIAAHILEAVRRTTWRSTTAVISVAGAPGGPSVTMREIGDAAYRRLDGKLPDGRGPDARGARRPRPGERRLLLRRDRRAGRGRPRDRRRAAARLPASSHDCGTVINPTIVDGQIHGGATQGIGGALYEEIVYGAGGPAPDHDVHGLPDPDRVRDPVVRDAPHEHHRRPHPRRLQGHGRGRAPSAAASADHRRDRERPPGRWASRSPACRSAHRGCSPADCRPRTPPR